MNKTKKKIILFDVTGERTWPEKLGGVNVCKVGKVGKVEGLNGISPDNVLLYLIHYTDFKDSSESGGKSSFLEKNYSNVLWYSGEAATIASQVPGHIYKISVPHGIEQDNEFFKLVSKLIDEININSINKNIWRVLYPQNTYLIALSILCQGYLAAHGGDGLDGWEDLPKNLRNIVQFKGKKEKTEERSWWEPALEADFKGKKLEEELETVDKEKNQEFIKCLIDIIKDGKVNKDGDEIVYFENGENGKEKKLEDGKIEEFTGKVSEAYGQIKEILGKDE